MTSKHLSSIPLWDHQRKAIKRVQRFLTAFKSDPNVGSALVHMPTGTGKTGVIGCISQFMPGVDSVLILSPRVELRDQLFKEICGHFFAKFGYTKPLPKTVEIIRDSQKKLPSMSGTIYLCTIQLLHTMMRKGHPTFDQIKNNIDLVIVDEGHYEPAISWSQAIRSIVAPKVLFTATPFRSDFKLFDVNTDHASSYSFKAAVRDKIVRRVEVHPRTKQSSPKAFVSDVIQFYDNKFPNASKRTQPPRVIIRCDSDETIRLIGDELQRLGKTHVLIHETFKDGNPLRPNERRKVPDPSIEPAVFWVHQYKLLEGIDDSRFQVLALYEELRDTRALVQQVGRIVRRPKGVNSVGYFLDHSAGAQTELWDDFLKYDSELDQKGIKIVDVTSKILKSLKQDQPSIAYLDGRFRHKLSLETIADLPQELMLSKSTNVLHKPGVFNLLEIGSQILADYRRHDRDVRLFKIDANTIVILYIGFQNSPLLRSMYFVECRLGATVIKEFGSFVCVYDTEGGIPDAITDNCRPATEKELQKLFSDSTSFLTGVRLFNSQLGPSSIRSRLITASKIDDTIPSFDEHYFVCRTALGNSVLNGLPVRLYVGFGRGKITDVSSRRVQLIDYIRWLDSITSVLASQVTSIASFARFAQGKGVPLDPAPTHLLLDLSGSEEAFLSVQGKVPLSVENKCMEVVSGKFSLSANGSDYAGTIEFNTNTSRYELDIPNLDVDFSSSDSRFRYGIVNHLNRVQSFRVIPASHGSFYTLGSFYEPRIQFGPKYDDDAIGLLKVLQPIAVLETVGSEKGQACTAGDSGWDMQSLFFIVDTLGANTDMQQDFGSPDILVCDDMGTEAADFILCNSNDKRVVFIHCKGNNKVNHGVYSASGLQEVCGQATKNLRYFSRFGSEVPPKAKGWHDNEWSASGVSGAVSNRIRHGPSGYSGLEVWSQIRSIISHPHADLQIWLLLGRLLKKSDFENEIKKANPAPEAQQATYLLFSTMCDVASVGARLKVFCSP